MKTIRYIFLSLLIICIGSLSVVIYQVDNEKRKIKEDLIELSNIKYGLFNVDEWKKVLATILSKKIEEFELKGGDRKDMKNKVSNFLNKVIADFEERYYVQNSGSIGGIFKSIGAKTFNIFGELKNNVPKFTQEILNFLNDPKNKKVLKSYLTSKLNEYADNTFAKMDYSVHDSIISKYKIGDRAETISSLNTTLDELQNKVNNYKYLLIVFSLLTAAYILILKELNKTEVFLLTGISFLFLITGLTLPMIEIDARVSEIKISLLGEYINFEDQVLYYKSKSIIEVIRLMLTQSGFDLLLVGCLVFVFSVLFPISKLITSLLLVSKPNLRSNKLVYFLVYKTGKWSMADVMVVAIFMAYVGFSGILSEQLNQIEHLSTKIDVFTTNKSSLQTGFFAFTSFALLSLLTTNKLQASLAVKLTINKG
ncbi:paraquat-inducible protein A [Aurantibacillus circumpalustris]|uniref:paraquat-inducible protein A n=1 Tax=Aurantibacillus circumpalustris TaxID=3036359 RepID=UPI00295C022A|nr:paraquat-inducible protein A [Aurantibacillus circumpalustris]